MSRILLRAHKDPFAVVGPRRVHKQNLIGDNVGNLLFSNASYKLLDTRGTQITTDPLKASSGDPDRISAEFDHVVIPLANAFRLSYADALDRLSSLIERVRVPVTVLGVGAQLDLDGSFERLEPVAPAVRRFVSAVLDKSPTIGVRGEHTERYLRHLGFRDVEVIGCPSVFMNGPDLTITKRAKRLTRSSRISMNLSPYVKGLGGMIESHTRRYPRLRYAAQHRDALGMLLELGAKDSAYAGERTEMPVNHAHPLVSSGRTSFFTDPKPWLDYLSGFDFSFGTRIHGNIAALAAGTPAYVLAHDSRTLELARYFDIPHRTVHRVNGRTDAADLYDEADYTAFNAGVAPRFERFTDFLGAHGLRHAFEEGEDPLRFDRRTAMTAYPGEIGRLPEVAPVPVRVLKRLTRPVRRPATAVA
ncbi:polysaccharide pyruvyl transferase family protein [Amnibacterium endophyticum]|uniref:Polysaccharide pyruvyl transferase family protein n=1 Tax=Amnibacterium endophyticum TaxID=2109337 RepID=A0ABW4LET6_9MICO